MSLPEISLQIVVPGQTRYLSLLGTIAELLVHALEERPGDGDGDALAYHLNLVLTEAMANVIAHASPVDGEKSVRVSIVVAGGNLYMRVFDQGSDFDIDEIPAADFKDLSEMGRRIFFIRALMDTVDYHKTETGNVLSMSKKLC